MKTLEELREELKIVNAEILRQTIEAKRNKTKQKEPGLIPNWPFPKYQPPTSETNTERIERIERIEIK